MGVLVVKHHDRICSNNNNNEMIKAKIFFLFESPHIFLKDKTNFV
jgi:hypothetical protein